MRLHSLFAPILALTLISAAHAGQNFVGGLTIPGTLPDKLNPQQQTVVGLMVIQARNALSGIDARTSIPWPCVVSDTAAGFMAPNSLDSYTRMKVSLAKQGWKLLKEIKSPGEDQYSMLFSKGGVNIMGMWAKAFAGTRSTVFLCQQVKAWKPAAPALPSKSAPRLDIPFIVSLDGWKPQARSVRVVAFDQNVVAWLLTRGSISMKGKLTLDLPIKPDPALLRSSGTWLNIFDLSDCDLGSPQGSVSISDLQVKLLVLGDIDVLGSNLSASASAAQVLNAPLERDHIIWSGSLSSGISKIRLVYSSGPLSIRGNLACADGSGNLKVDINLPGGWTALDDQLKIPDDSSFKTHTLLNPIPGQEKQGWHDSSF